MNQTHTANRGSWLVAVRCNLLIALTGFGLAPALLSQVVSPDPKDSTKPDEVVQLSPFQVTAGSDSGYLSSESVTGSRVATAIKDLPFTVNVITSEFMRDFGVFESNDNFGYTSSVSNVDVSGGGGSNMRGFTSQYMLRDGFFRLGTTDPVLIDRIEFIKGPNAAIYGETQPGGIVNMITKRPKSLPQTSASVTAGSYDTTRATVTSTGPVGSVPGTYYLFTGADFERGYEVPGASLRNRTASLGLEHKFDNGGDFHIVYGYMRNQSHSVQSNVPFLYNSTTKTYVGIASDLATINQNGPNSETTRDVNDLTATYEKRLNSIFSVRAAANWYHRHKWLFNAGNGTQYDYLNNTLVKGTPAEGLIGEDGGGVQADLLAQYKLFSDKVSAKTLLTFDFSDYYRWDPTWQLGNAYIVSNTPTTVAPGPDRTYWFKNIFVGQPINYSVPAFSSGAYNNVTRDNHNRASIWGGLLRQQMNLMQDRLLLFASLRYDRVVFNLRDLRGAGLSVRGINTAWSPSVGYNYKANSHLSFYGSRSNGFNANAQNQSAANGVQPSEKSWGYDYGIKASFFDDRLVFTAGGYYIVRRNVATTDVLANGTTVSTFTGSQLSRGAEFDFSWRATNNFTVLGGYGHNNNIYTSFGRDTGAVGFPPGIVPHDNFGVAGKYAFTNETLHGLSVNAGVTHVGSAPSQNPNTGDLFNPAALGGTYIGNDGRRSLMLPGYTLVELGATYQFRTGRFTQTLTVNVKNALDTDYIRIASAQIKGDGRGYYLTYGLGF